MADQAGRPIDTRNDPPAALPKGPTVKVDACLGCGDFPHGGVGGPLNCYAGAIVRLRAELDAARAQLSTWPSEIPGLPALDPDDMAVLVGGMLHKAGRPFSIRMKQPAADVPGAIEVWSGDVPVASFPCSNVPPDASADVMSQMIERWVKR